jgi:hypothetical protein
MNFNIRLQQIDVIYFYNSQSKIILNVGMVPLLPIFFEKFKLAPETALNSQYTN